jgi:hypothetical protein
VVRDGGDDTFGDTDDYANEVITVKTAGGDDHLTTLATSAIKAASSINLGSGENRLSLGWGDVSIDGSDLANIGGIKYVGQLNQLDILNDIELEDDSTLTLTMPGGVDNVSVLTLTDLEVNDDDGEASLTIDGAATNFTIESAEDFGVYQDDLIVLEVLGVENLTMTAGDEINIRLNGAELKTVNVSAEEDTDFEMDGEEGENAEFMNLTSIFLSAGDEVDAVLTHVRSGASLTARADADDGGEGYTYVALSHVTLGDVHSTVGYADDGNVNISGTTEDDVTVGNITLDTNAETADDANNELKIENNSDVVMQLGDISISGANTGFFIGTNTDLQLVGGDVYMSSVTGEDSFSNDDADMTIKDHTDSDITFGEITLESGSAYSEIFIDNNNKTNVSLAAEGLVSLMSCEGDANVYVSNNVNDHQQLGSGADANTGSESFTIELGNVNLDAGSETNLGVSGNSDETFFGDLTVRFGDINMVAYDSASLTVGEDGDGSTDLGSNFATTVEMGNVDVLAKNNINVDLSNNDGTIYDLGTVYSAATRYQQDNAVITTQDVTLTSDYGSVDVEIDDNVLAVIEMGNVDAVSYGDTSEVNFNVDDNISTNFLSGSIALTATGWTSDVGFSISGNESRAKLDGESAIINRYEINGNLTLDANSDLNVTSADIDINNNNGDAGDDAINLEIAITGDTSVSGDYAELLAANNDYVILDFEGTVSVTSNERNATLSLQEHDSSEITISGDVTLTSTNSTVYVSLTDNDSSDVTFEGKTTLFAEQDAQLAVRYNDSSFITMGDVSETVPLAEAATYDVSLTSEEESVGLYAEYNHSSGIFIGDVEMTAAADATVSVSWNNNNLGGWVSIGDMSVTVEEDVSFRIVDNDASYDGGYPNSLVTVGVQLEGEFTDLEDLFTDDGSAVVNGSIDLEGADVGTYDGSVISDGVQIYGNGNAVVLLGDFDITATDGDVTMRLSTDEQNWLQTGSITIAASEDVYFLAEAGYGEDYLETGDIDITAGTEASEVGSVNVDSSVFFSAYDLNGTENITIDALSKGTGEASVYADIDDAYDLKSLTVSGNNAEIYLNSDIGSNNVGDDFTLDLSGLTGSFDDLISITADETDSGSTYDALGEDSDNNNGQDGGSFVSTIDADFYGDVVVKVGTGDMIYNAQHSNFAGTNEYDDSNDTFDWNGDDGWFSLGDDLDLVPTVAEQSFYMYGYSYVNVDPTSSGDDYTYLNSVIFDTGEREFAVVQTLFWDDSAYYDESSSTIGWNSSVSWYELGGATWQTVDLEEVKAALGTDVQISYSDVSDTPTTFADFKITITGAADGTDFEFIDTAVRDYVSYDSSYASYYEYDSSDALRDVLTGLASGFDVTTSAGDEANDGLGNAASETFEFNADGIGEVIIGGFRANGFFEDAEVDRLDFSALADIKSAADLIITIDINDGYFDDIIIDFKNDDYGSVRLVGVGEYFTDLNVNGIANSIIFA